MVGSDFRIVRPLGAGGMGAVYLAEQRSTGKRRALKVMLPQLVADPKLRARFAQEARVGSLIESEHVVDVIAAGVDERTGAPWIAMELLEGRDLAAYSERRGGLQPREVGEVLRQLCHALRAAHQAGVVHRDIKPENVFVARAKAATNPTSVKVLDFGIAKVAAAAKTTATAQMGSPVWMAPEQTDPAADIGPSTDVWAVGLLSFWLLTGKLFWKAGNDDQASMHALMKEILLDPIPKASERAAQLGVADRWSTSFDAWFACCVVREPNDRFEDVRELYEGFELALSDWLGDDHTAAATTADLASSLPPPSLGPESVSTRSPLRVTDAPTVSTRAQVRRERRWPMAAISLIGVLVAVVLWAGGGPTDVVRSDPLAIPVVVPPQPPQLPAPTTTARSDSPDDTTPPKEAPAVVPAERRATAAAPPPPPPRRFDGGAASAAMQTRAIGAAGSCRNMRGAEAISVSITWDPSGVPRRPVTMPSAPQDSRAVCVKLRFEGIVVQPFDGPPMSRSQMVHF